MKKQLQTLGIITILLAGVLGVLFSSTTVAHTEDDPFVTQLIAGGGNPKSEIDVGEVQVWNDGETLYVKYIVDLDGWCIIETHLHIATDPGDIPQKNGNPIPGKFMENNEHGCVPDVLYTFDLEDEEWDCGETLYIAAHAVVVHHHVD